MLIYYLLFDRNTLFFSEFLRENVEIKDLFQYLYTESLSSLK